MRQGYRARRHQPSSASASGGGTAPGRRWVLVRSLAGKAREISPLLWIVAAGFLIYFARGPIEQLLG